MKVSIPSPVSSPDWTKLECLSTCDLAGDPTYIWFRNGFNVGDGKWYWNQPEGGEIFSCAVEGYEHLRSPVVCKSIPQYTENDTRCNGPLRVQNYMLI